MTYFQRRSAKQHQHRYFVDLDTHDALCLCGKVRGSKKAAPGKYNAQTTIYNGYPYESKFEAQTAMSLDWRKRAGEIKDWEKQYPIEIRSLQGELIVRHKVDFRLLLNDDSYELLEVKGFETRDYKLIRRLIETLWLPEHLDYVYTVAK